MLKSFFSKQRKQMLIMSLIWFIITIMNQKSSEQEGTFKIFIQSI